MSSKEKPKPSSANLSYFIQRTDERLENVEAKLDRLLEFKFRILGSAAAVAGVVSLAIGIASVYFGTH